MPMKTASQAAGKWKAGTAGAQALFVTNASAAAQTQVQNAISGADNWLAGINSAGTKGYVAGLNSSAQKGTYAKKINSVGGARYAQGTGAASDTFQAQITKVLAAAAAVPLTPRGPKGSMANIQRSTEMQQGLRAAKVNGSFQ